MTDGMIAQTRVHLQRLMVQVCDAHISGRYDELAKINEKIRSAQNALRWLPIDAALLAVNASCRSGDLIAGLKPLEDAAPAWPRTGHLSRRMWKGESISGKRILIYPQSAFDWGHGDQIQWARYLGGLFDSGAESVIVECHRELHDLLHEMDARPTLVAIESESEKIATGLQFDLVSPFALLPRRFESTLGNVPASSGYLRAPHAYLSKWRQLLGQKRKRLRVGLVWSGLHVFEREDGGSINRWCCLRDFGPILAHEDVEFFSIRKGIETGELAAYPNIRHISDEFLNYADTAAAIEYLDLVISIDGSVAHLAGAMGKPVWLLLNQNAAWIWFEDRADSPWYASMKIFRAPYLNAWEKPIREIAKQLGLVTPRLTNANDSTSRECRKTSTALGV